MEREEPIILPSARKHGIEDADMLHARRNPIHVWEQDKDDLTMIVGPARNGSLLEVGVISAADFEGLLIIHAMPARSKYLR